MRDPGRLVAVVLLLLGAGGARAGHVVDAGLRREEGWLVVDLQLAELLDARTRSTVESGLPGSCLLEIELRDQAGQSTATRRVDRALEVDLWEDVVRLIEAGQERRFRSIAAADSAWSIWSSLRLARWSSLAKDRRYQLRITLRVQPLGAEDRERVSRWVSESERGDRREVSIDVGGLVRRFFGSAEGQDAAEVWRGPEFTLDTVRESP